MSSSKFFHKLRTIIVISSSASLFGGCYLYATNDERFFEHILMPTFRLLPAETAHEIAVKACKYAFLLPFNNFKDPETLSSRVGNIFLKNPLGIAAGFDKNAEGVSGLDSIGFGFVEVGSITKYPQAGNEKPRVFRLVEDEAIVNRYGFNSDGYETVWLRLHKLRNAQNFNGVIGVNLGKNKLSENAVQDYCDGVKMFAQVSDYIVINVSSPNTPDLRKLQEKDSLKVLLTEVLKTNQSLHNPKPIFLKLSPDLLDTELKDICKLIKKKECKVAGLIISNTTVDRSQLLSKNQNEGGGLSGKPLKEKSTRMIEEVYKLTNGSIPIIGAGGISTGEDAYEKILAGASAVQIYSSFVYHGPPLVTKIKKELDDKLKENGFASAKDAVGKSHSKKSWFSIF